MSLNKKYYGVGNSADLVNSAILLPFLIYWAVKYQDIYIYISIAAFLVGMYFSWLYKQQVTGEWESSTKLKKIRWSRRGAMLIFALALLGFWLNLAV